MKHLVREARPEDALACADIVNDWIDATPWVPRVHSRDAIEKLMVEGLPRREAYVIGDPVLGYASINAEKDHLVALYTAQPGKGLGKALLDRARRDRNELQLWTHEPNTRAHQFYKREGFILTDRNPKGDDGIPELRMVWSRGMAA